MSLQSRKITRIIKGSKLQYSAALPGNMRVCMARFLYRVCSTFVFLLFFILFFLFMFCRPCRLRPLVCFHVGLKEKEKILHKKSGNCIFFCMCEGARRPDPDVYVDVYVVRQREQGKLTACSGHKRL